ncbi:hypothetical protein AAC387_Pa05g0707 [Persea americana]
MANSLVDLKEKGKTKTTKEAKNMRAMDDDDEEYQPLENKNNLNSDDHLSEYSEEEELSTVPPSSTQGSMPTPSSMVGIPGSLTTESTVALTPTQDLLVEQRTLSTTPTSLLRDMVRASTSKRVRDATRGINTERLIAVSGGTKLVVAVPLEDKFDIREYDKKEHVRRGIDRQCNKLYRTWRHNMKEHYEALVKAGKNPYIKPYRGVSGEDWAWMIGNIWTNKDKEVQLEARHQGDESRRKEDEALGLPVTMPQEEMPMEVLGKKFYVKEYGVGLKRPSSKQSSAKSHDEVRVLKNQVETLKDMCQEQKNQFETLKD